MPTYVYRREDGSTFEIEQRITEDALTHCPDTGQPVKRVITGAGLIFKGSGFYLTDYARGNGASGSNDASGANGASGSNGGSASEGSNGAKPKDAAKDAAKPDGAAKTTEKAKSS